MDCLSCEGTGKDFYSWDGIENAEDCPKCNGTGQEDGGDAQNRLLGDAWSGGFAANH
jgi:DnaJ-class molecular chaperone